MRTKFSLRVLATMALTVCGLSAYAEEKNGLLVTVSKKTLERTETRTVASARQDRTQGLALMVKNNSIKEFPTGEVQWTIVVRKTYAGGAQKYSGKEVLKALHPSASVELVLGAASMTGYRSDYSTAAYRDKLEYEVVITHNGKETLRTSSDPNFATLAEGATSMDREPAEPAIGAGIAARSHGRGIAPIPIPARPLPVDIKPAPATITPPGTTPPGTAPGTPPPNNLPPRPVPTPATTPPTPADPSPATPATPASPAAPAEATPPPPATPAPSGKPFDFFNLDKGKK